MTEELPRPADASQPAAAPPGRRYLVGVAVALAFLIPAGIGIAVGASVLGSTSSAAAPAPDPTTSAPVDDEVVEPTAEPAAAEVTPVEFSSASGNLRCHIDANTAYCHQGAFLYSEPRSDCAQDGVAIGVSAAGAYWPCLSARPAQGPAVEYDVPVVNGEFTCTINFTTGATCTNAGGAGFTIEYTAGVATF